MIKKGVQVAGAFLLGFMLWRYFAVEPFREEMFFIPFALMGLVDLSKLFKK